MDDTTALNEFCAIINRLYSKNLHLIKDTNIRAIKGKHDVVFNTLANLWLKSPDVDMKNSIENNTLSEFLCVALTYSFLSVESNKLGITSRDTLNDLINKKFKNSNLIENDIPQLNTLFQTLNAKYISEDFNIEDPFISTLVSTADHITDESRASVAPPSIITDTISATPVTTTLVTTCTITTTTTSSSITASSSMTTTTATMTTPSLISITSGTEKNTENNILLEIHKKLQLLDNINKDVDYLKSLQNYQTKQFSSQELSDYENKILKTYESIFRYNNHIKIAETHISNNTTPKSLMHIRFPAPFLDHKEIYVDRHNKRLEEFQTTLLQDSIVVLKEEINLLEKDLSNLKNYLKDHITNIDSFFLNLKSKIDHSMRNEVNRSNKQLQNVIVQKHISKSQAFFTNTSTAQTLSSRNHVKEDFKLVTVQNETPCTLINSNEVTIGRKPIQSLPQQQQNLSYYGPMMYQQNMPMYAYQNASFSGQQPMIFNDINSNGQPSALYHHYQNNNNYVPNNNINDNINQQHYNHNIDTSSRENSRGNFHGNSRGNLHNNSRGNSRGNPRGNSNNNSRGNQRGNNRGNSRGNFRGQPRGYQHQ
jgi:hypothetical protein